MKQLIFVLVNLVLMNSLKAQDLILPLYPKGKIPNSRVSNEVEKVDTAEIVRISLVQEPSIQVFLPAKRNANGKAVLICPGGGYGILAWDWEGTDIAKWLNSKGYAAIVLKYRLPSPKSSMVPHLSPIGDAKRAMRMVRNNAKAWNIDPSKIGVMGFSAGGHLASTLGTHFDAGIEGSEDVIEKISSRPDFMILVYPVISMTKDIMHQGSRNNLIGNQPDESLAKNYSNELQVKKDTPPTILIHASDDGAVPVQNSLLFYEALIANKVSATLHVFQSGGHGFGLGQKMPAGQWTDLCVKWMDQF